LYCLIAWNSFYGIETLAGALSSSEMSMLLRLGLG
jgi:hypothetical protein